MEKFEFESYNRVRIIGKVIDEPSYFFTTGNGIPFYSSFVKVIDRNDTIKIIPIIFVEHRLASIMKYYNNGRKAVFYGGLTSKNHDGMFRNYVKVFSIADYSSPANMKIRTNFVFVAGRILKKPCPIYSLNTKAPTTQYKLLLRTQTTDDIYENVGGYYSPKNKPQIELLEKQDSLVCRGILFNRILEDADDENKINLGVQFNWAFKQDELTPEEIVKISDPSTAMQKWFAINERLL